MMTPRDFCYWLQGFFELNPNIAALSVEQIASIKEHLNLVFKHEIAPLEIRAVEPLRHTLKGEINYEPEIASDFPDVFMNMKHGVSC